MNSDQIAQDLKKYQLWESADAEIRAYEKLLPENADDAEMAEDVQEALAGLVAYRDSLLTAEEAARIGDSIERDKEMEKEYRMRELLFRAFDKIKEHPEALLIVPALLPWWKNIKVLSGVTTIGVVIVAGWLYLSRNDQNTGVVSPGTPVIPVTEPPLDNSSRSEEDSVGKSVPASIPFQQETSKKPILEYSTLKFQMEQGENRTIRVSLNPFYADVWDNIWIDTLRLKGKYAYAYIKKGDDVLNFVINYKPQNEVYRLPTFEEVKGLYGLDTIQVAYTKVGMEWCSDNNTEKVAIYTIDPNSGKIKLQLNQALSLEEARNFLKKNYFKKNQYINPSWITPSFRLVKIK